MTMVQCVMLLVLFVLGAIASGLQPVLQPINLTLCVNKTSENVIKLRTDVFIVQTQQHESCFRTNTSTPVLFKVTNTVPDNIISPVVFVARSQNNVQTWQLPLNFSEFSETFYSVERTLCSVPPQSLSQWGQEEGEVIIEVFTSSTSGEKYTIEVTPVEDAELYLNEPAQLEVSFNSPAVRYFKFPENESMVKVQAWSYIKNACFILSVQEAACPVDVIPQDGLPEKGTHQTMLNRTTLPVIFKEDFFVVVMLTNSSACRSNSEIMDTNESYTKSYKVNITIARLVKASQYAVAMAIPVIVFSILFVGSVVLSIVPSKYFGFILKAYSPLKWLCEKCNCHCSCFIDNGNNDETQSLLTRAHGSSIQESSPLHDSALHEDSPPNQHEVPPIIIDSPFEKPERLLRLKDLFRTSTKTLEAQYKVYGWNAITVGIFYGLPAIQFVLIQQLLFYATGNEDLCYYNFQCAHPLEIPVPGLSPSPIILSAFNNIWSNIGYVMLGITFLFIAGIRHYQDYNRMKKDSEYFWSHGVPQFYGLYYAMGFGLILEGFMSSFYHICPSKYNFQFDTAFMFIIGGLLTIKILQARHPDINANAFLTFYCFAVVILLTMIGIYESKAKIRIILLTLVMIFVVIFCTSFYYFHNWSIGKIFSFVMAMIKNYRQECGKVLKWIKNTFTRCPCKHPIRMIRLTLVASINLIVVIIMAVVLKCGIPTIVLGLFVANFFSFLLCYLFFKVIVFKEPWTPAALINFLLLIGFWCAALLFFIQDTTDKTITPAESRDKNSDCFVLHFYDRHDVWHFLSACAMFWSFLFVMTLDDGVRHIPNEDIFVF